MDHIYPGDPQYFRMLNAPEDIEAAFEKIISYLDEVEEMSNVRSYNHLAKVIRAVNSLSRNHLNKTHEWSNQIYYEKKAATQKAKIDRIKGFEIGQLVKFRPKGDHHYKDGHSPYLIAHVIGKVVRRNRHTVSVVEVSRRRMSSEAEDTRSSGARWRMSPQADTIIGE